MWPFFPNGKANHSLLSPFRYRRRGYTFGVTGGKNLSEDTTDKVSDAIKHTVDDIKDSVHEAQHRSAADLEKAKRDELGDELTPSEKVGSALNEAKNRTQAEIDAAKRKIRDHT
jgi:hypothetical protein